MADEKRIALLIDAENISAQYADYIIGEVDNYGICSRFFSRSSHV